MNDARYELVVTAPATRIIRETLPDSVAFAVIAFITSPLLENPKRVGAPLQVNWRASGAHDAGRIESSTE